MSSFKILIVRDRQEDKENERGIEKSHFDFGYVYICERIPSSSSVEYSHV